MADIRINQLPLATGPSAPMQSDNVAIDGTTTRKTSIQTLVETGRPAASQAEAEAGVNASKAMTPLTTKQSIIANGMARSVYDPNNVNSDMFDFSNQRNVLTSTPVGIGSFSPRDIRDKLNDWVSLFDFPGATEEREKPESEQDWAPIVELAVTACGLSKRTLFVPPLHNTDGDPIDYWYRSLTSTDIGTGADHAVAAILNFVDIVFAPGAKVSADPNVFDGLTVTNIYGFITNPYPAGGIDSWFRVLDDNTDTTGVQSSGSGVSVWDIFGYDRAFLRGKGDSGVTTPSGDNIGSGGTDTYLTPHSCNHGHFDLWCRGFYDVGWYGSGNRDGGNINDGVGSYHHVEGYFERCGIAVTGKRDLWNIDVGPIRTWQCAGGIQASPADGFNDHGKVWNIHDYDVRETQGRPLSFTGGKKTIIGAGRIVDFALRISDQTYTAVANFNWIGAIGFYGESDPQVSGGYAIGYEDWTPPGSPPSNREPMAFVFGSNTVPVTPVGTSGAVVGMGTVDRAYRVAIETAESTNNTIEGYRPVSVPARPALFAGSGSRVYPLGGVRFSATKGGTDQTGVATGTVVTFGTEESDVGSFFASNRHTPLVAGDYLYRAQFLVSAGVTADAQNFSINIQKNSTPFTTASLRSTGTNGVYVFAEAIIPMNGTTDFVEVSIAHGTGGTVTISGATANTRFSGHLLK